MCLALISYSNDSDDYFPHELKNRDWKYVFTPWYAHPDKKPEMFHCVDYNEDASKLLGGGGKGIVNLQINAYIAGSSKLWAGHPTAGRGVKISSYNKPSTTAAIMEREWQTRAFLPGAQDNYQMIAYNAGTYYSYGPHRHAGGSALFACLDGHMLITTETPLRSIYLKPLFTGGKEERWW